MISHRHGIILLHVAEVTSFHFNDIPDRYYDKVRCPQLIHESIRLKGWHSQNNLVLWCILQLPIFTRALCEQCHLHSSELLVADARRYANFEQRRLLPWCGRSAHRRSDRGLRCIAAHAGRSRRRIQPAASGLARQGTAYREPR
ncbi:hypothetical protein D3C73_1319950 [compost metagenome]